MKDTFYHSTDKLYKIKHHKLKPKTLLTICLISTFILLISTIISFRESVSLNSKNADVKYNEVGTVDYKVYLKDNDYYDTSFLNSGMQYVASLIKTVNVKFNYQMYSTKNLAFDNNYKIVGELQITERDDPSKVLYSKKENLVQPKTTNVNDDDFAINEEVDIDYDKYNNIVNSYKKDLGLIVSSNLILTLETSTNGTYKTDKLEKDNKLQITIPLSEATLNIIMNSNEINNSGSIGESNNAFVVENNTLFILFIFLSLVTIFSVVLDIYIYIKNFKKDIYKVKVGKILKDYDRLIVNGRVNINEDNYENVVIIDDFKEMVDAAQNINQSILFYETIPNEKCFFVVLADKTLYKYRLTRAFLEKYPNNKKSETEKKFEFVESLEPTKRKKIKNRIKNRE